MRVDKGPRCRSRSENFFKDGNGSDMSRLVTNPTKWLERPAKTQISLGNPLSLIRVFAVRMKKAWVLCSPLSAQRRLWSDWADAQADLSLRWAHMSVCWFCHELAYIKRYENWDLMLSLSRCKGIHRKEMTNMS